LFSSGLILGLCLSTLGFLDFLKPKLRQHLRPHYQISHHFISMQKIKIGLAATRKDVLALVNQTCREMGVKCYRLIVKADEKGKGGLDYTYPWDSNRHLGMEKVIHSTVDSIQVSGGFGAAHWVFDPPTGQEDLDMEYRVLVSEIMKEALQVAIRLGKHRKSLEISGRTPLSADVVSGQALRRAEILKWFKAPRPHLHLCGKKTEFFGGLKAMVYPENGKVDKSAQGK